jgi:hypothetical protein
VNIVSIVSSTICLGLSYAGSPRWRRHRAAALAFAGLLIAAFVAQYLTLHKGAPYGITNRLFVGLMVTWFITNSLWLKAVIINDRTIDLP